jgi:glycosyltransferase involved in cell wall biosynthesis
MLEKPEVSVVIPTRNRRDVLRTTLRCALAQRDVDLEVIVVDDASADGTAEEVRARGDPRVRVVSEHSRAGVSAARNRGIEEATGRWVAFLDDDDLWSPDKLVRQLEAAERDDRVWVYAGDVNVDDALDVLTASRPPAPSTVVEALRRYNPVPTGASNVVVRADVLTRVGGFDPALHRTEDWDLWIRLARIGPPAAVESPLVAYRFHAGNRILDAESIVREPEILAARYGMRIDRAAVLRRAAWVCLRRGSRFDAIRYYARATVAGDARSLLRLGVALVHPAVGSERVFRMLPNAPGDPAWREEAQRWLDDVKRSARAAVPR